MSLADLAAATDSRVTELHLEALERDAVALDPETRVLLSSLELLRDTDLVDRAPRMLIDGRGRIFVDGMLRGVLEDLSLAEVCDLYAGGVRALRGTGLAEGVSFRRAEVRELARLLGRRPLVVAVQLWRADRRLQHERRTVRVGLASVPAGQELVLAVEADSSVAGSA